MEEAAGWYKRYREMAPDDLLGLKKLTEVSEALGRPEAAALQEELEAKTDDRRIVAGMLGVLVEDVELGPNLVENGEFEEWVDRRPVWWAWSDMATGDPWNKGVFIGGSDSLDAYLGNAARVDGLWLQYRQDKEPGRCGYCQWDERWDDLRSITLTIDTPYMLDFCYRTERLPDWVATVWVSYEPMVLFGGDRVLPATTGEWRHFVAVGWNRAGVEAAIRPLLRSWAPGSVQFDDVQVQPIQLPEGTAVEASETQFWVIGQDDLAGNGKSQPIMVSQHFGYGYTGASR